MQRLASSASCGCGGGRGGDVWNVFGRRDERGGRARGGGRKKETCLGTITTIVEGGIPGSPAKCDQLRIKVNHEMEQS